MNNALLVSALLLLSSGLCAQQREQTVQLESTISGNQEQPKTIYVLPWQSPVSLIRIPGQPLQLQTPTVSPLDRSQFLRFIAVQQSNTTLPIIQSVNSKEQ